MPELNGDQAERVAAIAALAEGLEQVALALERCQTLGISMYDALAATGIEVPAAARLLLS